jgi:hypothetical protein
MKLEVIAMAKDAFLNEKFPNVQFNLCSLPSIIVKQEGTRFPDGRTDVSITVVLIDDTGKAYVGATTFEHLKFLYEETLRIRTAIAETGTIPRTGPIEPLKNGADPSLN